MDDEEFLLKLREAFAVEAEEHLQAMIAGLLELEKTTAPDQRTPIVETIFREAHSLKGAARAVNRIDIEAVCQALESVFAKWKREGPRVSAAVFDVLNGALDLVAKLCALAEAETSALARSALQETVRQIARLSTAGPAKSTSSAPTAAPPPAVPTPPPAPVPPPPVPTAAAEASGPPPPAPALPSARTPPPPPRLKRLTPTDTLRVPMAKLDALLLQSEEMVAVKLVAAQQVAELQKVSARLEAWRKEWQKVRARADGAFDPGGGGSRTQEFLVWNESQIEALEKSISVLAKTAEHDERIVAGLVDDLLVEAKQLVMLPCARLLESIPKQVRDLARAQGKEIELAIRGGDVELDKRILEEMKAPLLHLVRNSIDHGLETPEERVARGKPRKGLLWIAVAQREGNKVELLVSDDGNGIDVKKVVASAVSHGVIGATEANELGEAAALALIFHSGISTSPMLTEISGRGLGMAIVREKIDKLGGQIAIETKPLAGTSFRILLPVTLATFKGILVCASGQSFVVPTASVERIKRVKREEIQTVENRETISHEGRVLALTWLADVLELPRREPKEALAFIEVMILGSADGRMAFAVEGFLNEQEVLVKNLGKPLLRVRNIAAATVLGSGAPVLILHIPDLLKSAVRLAASGPRQSRPVPEVGARARRVLVADDSVTSRMLLKNILETAGYQVTTAIDGMEAFTTLRGGDFEVVVTDVEMPRMNGFELTEKIRTDKKFAELPVVLITALSSREDRERGVDAGANAYLVKSSFDQSNLLEVIQRLI